MAEYLDFGIYFLFYGSLSSLFLQSTEAAIVSHLVSVFTNVPLKIGDAADIDKNKGDKIDS